VLFVCDDVLLLTSTPGLITIVHAYASSPAVFVNVLMPELNCRFASLLPSTTHEYDVAVPCESPPPVSVMPLPSSAKPHRITSAKL